MTKRICFECDHRYVGNINCPACLEPAGEPLEEDVEPSIALLECGWTLKKHNGHYVFYDEEGDFVAEGETLFDALGSVEKNLRLRMQFTGIALANSAIPKGGIEA